MSVAAGPRPDSLLELDGFNVALPIDGRLVAVVDDVPLRVAPGSVTGVVGESGSGKSVLAAGITRLLPEGARVSARSARFAGEDLLAMDERALLRLRGARVGTISQEPMTALNPVFTVGEQVAEAWRTHRPGRRGEARDRTLDAFRAVGIPAPERRLRAYPHELSGGLRQRVVIAMALVCEPALLIADEPTTALDVTVQAQILHLLADLRDRTGAGVLLITHNLGVVAEVADRVAVMYAGRVVEQAPAAALFRDAQHPYTLALLAATPSPAGGQDRLEPIPGRMPAPADAPAGCRFAPRCPFAVAECEQRPALRPVGPDHDVACWRAPVEALA